MSFINAKVFKNKIPCTLTVMTALSVLFISGSINEAAATSHKDSRTVNKRYELSLDLAMEAAREGVRVCEANGYQVTLSIVDASGVIKLQAKGDGSAIHTKDSSYGKAYTIASMGRVFNFDTTGQFAKKLIDLRKKKPELAAVANIPGILALAGGVAVRAYGEIIAGIGVGGAPGGGKDEVCAQAALAKISDRLPK